jgi:hypothetical protein
LKWNVGRWADREEHRAADTDTVHFFHQRNVLSVLGEHLAENRVAGLDVIGRTRETAAAHVFVAQQWRHMD